MSSSDDGSEGNSVDMISSKKEYDEQNNVNNITEGIDSVVLNDMSTCAACGKEGNNNDMNTCNKCKSVKYCNAACKKKHRKKHKKECEKRVTELHDEQLFKEVEPEECPICFLILPGIKDTTFKSCCGKIICNGCNYSMVMSEGKDLCAFCRMPPSNTSDEQIKRIKKLMESGNSEAFNQLAGHYAQGTCGLSQNWAKANELMLKAGELGCAGAYFNLGCSYRDGDADVEIDMRKARHYFELAAMEGNVSARYNLGFLEYGNLQRAYKHFILAAKAGDEECLDAVKQGFMKGIVTKDEYASTLRAYYERQQEMKSDSRDKAEASDMFNRQWYARTEED